MLLIPWAGWAILQAMASRVYITGLGFISSIGNSREEVDSHLLEGRHGIVPFVFDNAPRAPVHVLATVKAFQTESLDAEDWEFPARYKIPRSVLRGLSPHGLYAHCALIQAIEDAGLKPGEVSHDGTGLFTASAGSIWMMNNFLNRMHKVGVDRVNPKGIVATISGTLNFNLVAALEIRGSSCGFVSACASSGHALGFAYDEILTGRQDRMLVVGAEDGNADCILPFAGMRALSVNPYPDTASRPFDKNRDGFVGTGGAAALVLESEAAMRSRGASPVCEMLGWGKTSDGYNPVLPEPDGEGLYRSMRAALRASGLEPGDVDYINAHAPSTQFGDLAEVRALNRLFTDAGAGPAVSSTKALHGHGLSMASALEAGITALSLAGGYAPGAAHIEDLEEEAKALNIPRRTEHSRPRIALSNSSGFGGANVTLVLRAAGAA